MGCDPIEFTPEEVKEEEKEEIEEIEEEPQC